LFDGKYSPGVLELNGSGQLGNTIIYFSFFPVSFALNSVIVLLVIEVPHHKSSILLFSIIELPILPELRVLVKYIKKSKLRVSSHPHNQIPPIFKSKQLKITKND
jgi:hypothetical protein